MTDPVPPRLSATVLLVRDRPRLEVLMVKRHHQIDFASGALVFPGGKIDPQDSAAAWEGLVHDPEGVDPQEQIVRIAALREAQARKAMAEGRLGFDALVASFGLKLDLLALQPFARWVTPIYMPKRFDTHFFLAHAPAEQLAVCDGWETVDAEWIRPDEALELEKAKERTIIFPTRMNLKLLAEAGSAADAVARARSRPRVTVTPWVEKRPSGPVLVIQPDAGYGAVEEDLASVGG